MGTINKRLEVTTPPVFRVQELPVLTERGNYGLVPDYLTILEEVQVYSATLEVNGIHGLRPTCL